MPDVAICDLGVDIIAPFERPAEDRNRTSPFPYGGHRFEFRAVGSSQNVSMVNTVLCTAIASCFDEMAEAFTDGNELEVAAKMLEESWPVIFNGNGYGAEWPPEAEKRGLHIQNSNPEAIQVSSKQQQYSSTRDATTHHSLPYPPSLDSRSARRRTSPCSTRWA